MRVGFVKKENKNCLFFKCIAYNNINIKKCAKNTCVLLNEVIYYEYNKRKRMCQYEDSSCFD